MDLPIGSHSVTAHIEIRRFKCSNKGCLRKIFSEQLSESILPYARRTVRATETLTDVLVEVSAQKGSYLTDVLKMKQSSSTCLRIVSSLSIADNNDVQIIGIDDWVPQRN